MHLLHVWWRHLAHGALMACLLAGCSRELSRSVAPKPESQFRGLSRAGTAISRAGAHPSASPNNLPPLATIISPVPTHGFQPNLEPPVTFEWTGEDPESHLREYRFRLFGTSNPDFPSVPDFIAYLQLYPQAVMDHYAPGFDGWERLRVRGGSARAATTYSDLVPGSSYAFAVVAIDQRGDHDPDLSAGRNLIVFNATTPRLVDLTLTGPFGVVTNPTEALVVPAGVPVAIHWSATPRLPGVVIVGYRSSVDAFPPTGEPSPADTTATFPPSAPGVIRLLYVEVHLADGHIALGVYAVRFATSAVPAGSRSIPTRL